MMTNRKRFGTTAAADCSESRIVKSNKDGIRQPRLRPQNIEQSSMTNPQIGDGCEAMRPSPDAEDKDGEYCIKGGARSQGNRKIKMGDKASGIVPETSNSSNYSLLSELSDVKLSKKLKAIEKESAKGDGIQERQNFGDRDAVTGEDEEFDEVEVKEASTRPPPVNSSYLPLPWKGRLGYACLCTYLRSSNPPVFSSRTCRIASIIENRHPLKDPTQPPHPTKNRPDRNQPANIARGQAYVEELGLANARDVVKMLKWNDKYGIKFMRLSSEMFPFASHEVYGYRLAPFASEVLAEAGKVAADFGHRLTTHPGQFTQLGSPRKEVIKNAIRDLEYHAEMLDLLKLPDQQNRDAVMILHMGGTFGDKQATLDRFRVNYKHLSQNIKDRLVLENDDMSWSVHDLLPICEELNIPLVLDYHHNNIVFDSEKIREGTLDIMNYYDRIKATWTRKRITQKMHYSEPTPGAVTGQQRRKHSPRVATLPPCPPDMDLMIEAKNKEQAVFELMRNFKLPGYDLFNDIIPHVRSDENKLWKPSSNKKTKKSKVKKLADVIGEIETAVGVAEQEVEKGPPPIIPDDEVGMGGPERRVYWPPGMEEWLRPPKRLIKKKEENKEEEEEEAGTKTRETLTTAKKRKGANTSTKNEEVNSLSTREKKINVNPKKTNSTNKRNGRRILKTAPTPTTSEEEVSELGDMTDESIPTAKRRKTTVRRQSGRARKVNYAELSDEDI
ncbi:MAG: UV-damage endonuclease [Cirrosporium novae-zelandiae]|nr:MAG: UV-damage endonuclease [Cirrosporium novae-zelandiae]KAI9735540.1 MAG: UV-damage endonuclease [Cirrosporium novae-zelandiae]